jgi:cyanoexosortase A
MQNRDILVRLIQSSPLIKLDGHKLCWVILATLATLQLLLYSRYINDFNSIAIQGVVVIGLFWKVYQKQCQLSLKRDLPSQLFGLLIILLLLLRAKYIFITEASVFSYFLSWFTFIGYILLIAGFKGLQQFHQEIITCIGLTLVNPLLAGVLFYLEKSEFPLTVISAKLTAFLLWYMGFNASSQGQVVYVNGGAIDIYMGCTAIPLFLKLVEFSFLILLLFRSFCRNLSLLFILPTILSLVFSIIRLAIMALVVNNPEAFEFWHGLEGGNLFLTIALVVFFDLLFIIETPQVEHDALTPIYTHSMNQFHHSYDHQLSTPLWLLRSSSVVLLLILFSFMVINPHAGANLISEYKFPLTLDLSTLRSWTLKDSAPESLFKVENDQDNNPEDQNSDVIEFNQALSARLYLYNRGNESIRITLRYIVNTFGDVKSYYIKTFENLPQIESHQQVQDTENYYLQFSSQGQQYQTACLNVDGKTTVTGPQFVSYFRQGYINPTKLFQWLIGKRLLQDRRCLWIELSTPSTPPQSTLTDSERRQVWQTLVDYWRSNFPPFRG